MTHNIVSINCFLNKLCKFYIWFSMSEFRLNFFVWNIHDTNEIKVSEINPNFTWHKCLWKLWRVLKKSKFSDLRSGNVKLIPGDGKKYWSHLESLGFKEFLNIFSIYVCHEVKTVMFSQSHWCFPKKSRNHFNFVCCE